MSAGAAGMSAWAIGSRYIIVGAMKNHTIAIAALAVVAIAPLVAQSPKGWKMRVDRSTAASDPDAPGDIKFVTSGSGFHATNPDRGRVLESGEYRDRKLYSQRHVHPDEAERPQQLLRAGVRRKRPRRRAAELLYFLVAQNGSWLIKRRDGEATSNRRAEDPERRGQKTGRERKIHQRPGSPRGRRQDRLRGERHRRHFRLPRPARRPRPTAFTGSASITCSKFRWIISAYPNSLGPNSIMRGRCPERDRWHRRSARHGLP